MKHDPTRLITRAARGVPRNGWLGLGLGLGLAAAAGAWLVQQQRRNATATGNAPVRDYSDRSGLPAPPDAMRGRGRGDFLSPSLSPSQPRTIRSWASDAMQAPKEIEET